MVNTNLNTIWRRPNGALLPTAGIDGWLFSKKGGYTSDGLEVINTMGDNALVGRRLVAGFDGIDDYISTGSTLIGGSSSFDMSCVFVAGADVATRQYFCGEHYSINNGFYILDSSLYFRYTIGGVGKISSISISPNTIYTARAVYDGSSLATYLNGIMIDDLPASGGVAVGDSHFALGAAVRGSTGLASGQYFSGDILSAVALVGGSEVLSLQIEGNTYDVSGNSNHGTNNGADLTATYTDTTDGVYSYNLIKGYGYKVDGTTLVPRLSDGSGWADTGVVDERSAGFWHNMATAWVNFPATDAIWDKSDTAIWEDAVRTSDYYDSSNTFLWHPSELSLYFLSQNIKTAYANRLFSWDTKDEWLKSDGLYLYEDPFYLFFNNPELSLTRIQNILAYDVVKVDPDLLKITKYLDTKGGGQ